MSGKRSTCRPHEPRGLAKHEQREHCDQTYRNQFSHEFCQRYSHRKRGYHPPGVFLKSEPTLTHKEGRHLDAGSKPPATLSLRRKAIPLAKAQSRQDGLVPFASLSAISGTVNSLFKVLFTFPSWYLFAIGLEPIFSFR